MIIDFHTHAFPDKIAKGAMSALASASGLVPFTDGTVSDTSRLMAECKIDRRVMLSIATNPKQQTNVNNFAIETNKEEGIYAFGSVHPMAENALSELERLKNEGLRGIKLHPEYQGFEISDEKMYPIYEKCIKLGLIIVFHAGKDIGFPDSLNASCRSINRLSKDFSGADFVMAHFGGCMQPEEALEYVAGCGFYIDTSFSKGYISKTDGEKIIKKQGAEKVLFASDCPWASPYETFEFINSFDLTEDEKLNIFSKNALRLLEKC